MQLYNSLTHKKEEFTPAKPGVVSMYVCGITAYDYCHVGHARSAVVFDVLARYLRGLGLAVTFTRNFTDVDDKIIARANQEGISSAEVAEKYIAAFYEDMDRLNVQRADKEPRATEHIPGMIKLCEELISQGKAYASPSGDVYFRVRAFDTYGALSGRSVDELRVGARVAPGEEKEDPLDFALWKAAKPGEPSWDSPWGKGRPGWHIECSAMSAETELPLDIHGGGQDLIFPHHENEIAQSEAAFHKPLARFWVHNGFVQIDSEKMSKSLGNFRTIRDILALYLPETLRAFLLTRHYRSPIDFTFDGLDDSEKNVKRVYETLAAIRARLEGTAKWSPGKLPLDVTDELNRLLAAYDASMADDLNTAAALGHAFGIMRLANRVLDDKGMNKLAPAKDLLEKILAAAERWSDALGLFGREPTAWLEELRANRLARKGIDVNLVNGKLEARAEARARKDFAATDAIRAELAALGIEVRDTPAGQAWDVV